MTGRLNPALFSARFGIEPQEHIGLLQHALGDYEGGPDPDDENETWSMGKHERGRPYGPEDFELLRVDELSEPDRGGSTHEVEIERGGRYRSIYGWNRETGEKQIWMD